MKFFGENDLDIFNSVRFQYIITELDGPIFRITLNRPEKRNAFTPTMASEIAYAMEYADMHTEVRCVIVNANGPVFCAGADLNAFHDTAFDIVNESLPAPKEEIRIGDVFKYFMKPSIAIIEGSVFAGGFLIVAGCNFVYSVPGALFGLPEVKRGIWPMQVMASLENIIAPKQILEMAITGKNFTAYEMQQAGLVNHIYAKDIILKETESLTKLIVSNAPLAIKAGLEAFKTYKEIDNKQQHRFLQEKLNEIMQSEDAKEGIAAFREKRQPIWQGK